MRGRSLVGSWCVAASITATVASAQGAPREPRGLSAPRLPLRAEGATGSPNAVSLRVVRLPAGERAPWWAPVASVLVPGSGQALLGQQRGVAYVVAEAYLLVQAVGAQRDVTQGVRNYQGIAADAARRAFGGSLPVGPWSYYEDLEKFDASGMYDIVPGGMVDPETDTTTFNGRSWLLARKTFWSDPDVPPAVSSEQYRKALAFYSARAWGDEFRWSWRDAQLQKDVYRGVIAAANRSNQRKTNLLTVVGANHLASLIDAYINVRIRRYGGAGVAGMRLDGVDSRVAAVGDPAAGVRSLRTSIRLVPSSARAR
jgi:hypothetical protein